MENRGRASHIWKFFQTSCKGYTWQCCCFWLFYSLWKEMWADLAIHEQEKVIELCISIQSSVMCLYALTWNYTRYLSWSRCWKKSSYILLHTSTYMVPPSLLSLEHFWCFAEMFSSEDFKNEHLSSQYPLLAWGPSHETSLSLRPSSFQKHASCDFL